MLTRIFLLVTLVLSLLAPPAAAQSTGTRRHFIRDAEVENTIRTFATPLFQAAGLDPGAVRIHLMVDNTLNAFVAGGQNMFFHTGLLIRAESPNQLIGVIAHETGHIAGGHLLRGNDAMSNASTEALLGMLLGAAAGAATGRADVGGAIMMGTQNAALRDLLAFTRSQEQQADQMAMRYLDFTGQSAKGMLEFFEVLGDQELLVAARQDPYVRTHPLTRDRVAFVRNHVEHAPPSAASHPEWDALHRRMRAKLFAFVETPVRTFQRYKDTDPSVEARYARAIAAYRKPDLGTAIPLIDGLLKDYPDDPYFWELKGQILYENGRGRESIEPYRKAVALLPDNALLRAELGHAEIELESDDPAILKDAAFNLSIAVEREPDDPGVWKDLGTAFMRGGNEGMASYALSEHFLLMGKVPESLFHANKAEQLLGKTGPVWLRIQDVKARASQVQSEMSKRKK